MYSKGWRGGNGPRGGGRKHITGPMVKGTGKEFGKRIRGTGGGGSGLC